MSIMTDQKINDLAYIFKSAILSARDEGLFDKDICFYHFPRGCCGDTCDLLASFLKSHGIPTIYVCGDYKQQSHAWLVVNDDRVKSPRSHFIETGTDYLKLLGQYGQKISEPIKITYYEAEDLRNGLIIDITADQFGEPSVYVGKQNRFYKKHNFCEAHVCKGVCNSRLSDLYRKTSSFLPTK